MLKHDAKKIHSTLIAEYIKQHIALIQDFEAALVEEGYAGYEHMDVYAMKELSLLFDLQIAWEKLYAHMRAGKKVEDSFLHSLFENPQSFF